ncbi:MAG: rhodanese-like domain-containing protein [Phycisphaeraceae bacterium]
MQTIQAKQLDEMNARGDDFLLINVLPEDAFQERHIPGSMNIPVEREDFEEQVEQLAGDKTRTVVVYCASTDCTASPTAANKLEDVGFTHVIDFAGGMQEWEETKHPVETGPD